MCKNSIFPPRMCKNSPHGCVKTPVFPPRMCKNSVVHYKVRARYKSTIYFRGFRIKSTGTSPPPSYGGWVDDGEEVLLEHEKKKLLENYSGRK